MNAANPIQESLTRILAAILLAVFIMAGNVFAIDQPPQEPEQQRAWLVGHIITDMEALGTFDGITLAKVPSIVNTLTDEQVALLAQYYFLTRSKTEQDAYLFSLQQKGYTDEQVNEAKAEIADLLTEMQNQGDACYSQIQTLGEPVQYLAQVCYASVPGWCCGAGCFVPEWYYDNGSYVGPCYNAAYSGSWAVPICNAYHDHGSHFYSVYHNVAQNVHINRSTHLAQHHADWLRHHGDWHNTLAHDRLLHQSQHKSLTRFSTSRHNHVGNRALALHKSYAAVAHGGSNHAHVGKNKSMVHQQKSKTHGKHASASHLPKAQHQAAKTHANHVLASHQHASKPAHASHSKPASHAPAHAAHSSQQKHR